MINAYPSVLKKQTYKFINMIYNSKPVHMCMGYYGVDRKGWVPVPHPGYHYSNIMVAVSFPKLQAPGGNQN